MQENLSLFSRNTAEVIGGNWEALLTSRLSSRQLRVYWGTATTGVLHYGYLVPLLKIRDLLSMGCHVTILIADLHAMLDAQKSPEALLEARSTFYTLCLKHLLRLLKIPVQIINDNLEFVKGSSFQLDAEYTKDLYRLCSKVTDARAVRAGAEVVKQGTTREVGALLYPIMQSLDEKYLKCDVQMGGRDQRKIFVLAQEILPKIGYKHKVVHLCTEMLPALAHKEGKMSASDPSSKIDFFDSDAVIRKKINKANAVAKDVAQTPLLQTVKLVLLPIFEKFQVKREKEFGGDKEFKEFGALEKAYEEGELHPKDLKNAVAEYLIEVVKDVRREIMEEGGALRDCFEKGYEAQAKQLGLLGKKKTTV